MAIKNRSLLRERAASFLHSDRIVWLLAAVLLLERLAALHTLGVAYTLASDDLSYVKSGIVFAQTGTVTMHSVWPSAQIMPGMTWLIGLFALIFGRGTSLWLALKLLWCAMGSLTGVLVFQSVRLYAPRWCAVLAVLPLFGPDFVWTDNLILTETPFLLCFTAMIYFTLRMGRDGDWRAFWGCLAAYLGGLLLKANIALYPLFALAYLLCVHYPVKKLLRQAAVLACAAVCFLVPWTIRNYRLFDAFIPLTYGAGNPQLLGTYQGIGFPHDEDLNYQTNVDDVVRRTYARYYSADGTVPERYQKYLSLQRDGIQARYRMSVWRREHPGSFVISYLVLKPLQMIRGTFYWKRLFGIPGAWVQALTDGNGVLCLVLTAAALARKRARPQVVFLAALYLGNVFIYAMTFVYGRYNLSLMPARLILLGIGLGTLLPFRRRHPA